MCPKRNWTSKTVEMRCFIVLLFEILCSSDFDHINLYNKNPTCLLLELHFLEWRSVVCLQFFFYPKCNNEGYLYEILFQIRKISYGYSLFFDAARKIVWTVCNITGGICISNQEHSLKIIWMTSTWIMITTMILVKAWDNFHSSEAMLLILTSGFYLFIYLLFPDLKSTLNGHWI